MGSTTKSKKPLKASKNIVSREIILQDAMSISAMPLATLPPPHGNATTSSNPINIMYKNTDKGVESLARWKSYYPFGMNTYFEIDVLNCTRAPSHMVYRGIVPKHVTKLVREFCTKPQSCVVVADLMPYDPSTNLPLENVQNKKLHSYKYWVISGQYSIEAAKSLQMLKLYVLDPIKETYRFRSSRILVNCPCKDSIEI